MNPVIHHPGFSEALEACVKHLMYRTFFDVQQNATTPPVLETCKTAETTLKESIGLGGGATFYNHIGNYWMYWTAPGLKIRLVRHEEGDNITDTASRSQILTIAERIYNNYHQKERQLTLFV